MATEQNRILIELFTVAHLAGVEQAQKSFLGMNAATLGLAAVLAGAILVGKAGVENYNSQETALNELKQAVDAYNASAGKTVPTTEAQTAALSKATDASSKAQDSLTMAYNAVEKAQLSYSEAVAKHGAKSDAAIKASLSLQDTQIRLRQAQQALAASQQAVTDAQDSAAPVVRGAAIDLAALNAQFDTWLENNKKYVPNQYDARTALASFVRAGSDANESMQMLNDALDLATIKHEDVSEAAKTLILAEAGNARGLRDLGVTTAEYNAIMKSTLSDADKHAALLALIETKTKDGRKATDENRQAVNARTREWQNFTTEVGPGVVALEDKLNEAATTGLGILELMPAAGAAAAYQWQTVNSALWVTLQSLEAINPLLAGIFAMAGIHPPTPGSPVPGMANYSTASHARPTNTTGQSPIQIRISTEPGLIAKQVSRNLQKIGAV